jgi:hypothetical protein
MPRQNPRNIPVGNPVTNVKSAAVPPNPSLYKSPQWTDILSVPVRTPMFTGNWATNVQTDNGLVPFSTILGLVSQTWIIFWQSLKNAGGGSSSGGVFHRTLDLKDTTIRDNAADDVVVYEPGTAQFVVATLRDAIAADLTVNLNLWIAGVSNLVGTFTIPKTTPVHTALQFSSFSTTVFPNLSVLTWDVTASDGSIDPGGVASFTVVWQ